MQVLFSSTPTQQIDFMPVNKNANIRYQALDRCFRDKRHKYFMEDLIKACEDALVSFNFEGSVSRRQIFDDINYMESDAGYQIELERKRDGKRVYYQYSDDYESINQQPISKAEAQQLQQAISTLTRFRGLPHYEWIEEVITNLEHRFNLEGRSVGTVYFEQNPLLKGLEYLGTLVDAATEHKVLKIEYRNYKNGGSDFTYIFHTYFVKQYNNRWFAFGRSDATSQITNLALDRIKSIEPMQDMKFLVNDGIDFDHYFDDVVGVTVFEERKKQKIVLQASEGRYPYIASKPIHHSQRVEDRKRYIFSIEVRPNLELEQQILSFGPDLEVLAPEDFREQIKRKIEQMQKKYSVVKKDRTAK